MRSEKLSADELVGIRRKAEDTVRRSSAYAGHSEKAVYARAAVRLLDHIDTLSRELREACALLLLDETATPVSIYTIEEADYGDGFVKVELDPSDVVVQCRLEFAKAIRSLQDDEAANILDANCPTPKDTPER